MNPIIFQLMLIRESQGKSQRQVCRDMGKCSNAVHQLENSGKFATLEGAQLYAEALGYELILVPKEDHDLANTDDKEIRIA